MIFLTGILAVLHICLLPGFIVGRLLGFHEIPVLRRIPSYFALSLTINYLSALLLVISGMYTRPVVLGIIAIELVIALWLLRGSSLSIDFKRVNSEITDFIRRRGIFFSSIFLIGILITGVQLINGFEFLDKIFSYWDAVISWNNWAVKWASNALPSFTGHYPQLIPACTSYTYLITGNSEVQVFARAVMGCFPLMTMLLFLGTGLSKKNSGYFFGLAAYVAILRYFYKADFIFDGYVDIATAFFAFLTFVTIHESKDDISVLNVSSIFIFASAASAVKQAGLFIFIYAAGWYILAIFCRSEEQKRRGLLKSMIAAVLIFILVSGSWYIFKEIQISKGQEYSEIYDVTQNIHGNRDMKERLVHAVNIIIEKPHHDISDRPGKYSSLLLSLFVFIVLLGVFSSVSRNSLLFIAIPFFMIWALLFSYDYRNLTMSFPFFALAFGGGIDFIRRRIRFSDTGGLRLPGIVVVLIAVAIVGAAAFFRGSGSELAASQLKQMKMLGAPPVNEKMFQYKKLFGIKGKILTGYRFLAFVPGFRKQVKISSSAFQGRDFENLVKGVGSYDYMLNGKKLISPEGKRVMNRLISEGKITLLFDYMDMVFIKRTKGWKCELNRYVTDQLKRHRHYYLSTVKIVDAVGERGGMLRLRPLNHKGKDHLITVADIQRFRGVLGFRSEFSREGLLFVEKAIAEGHMEKLLDLNGCIMVRKVDS